MTTTAPSIQRLPMPSLSVTKTEAEHVEAIRKTFEDFKGNRDNPHLPHITSNNSGTHVHFYECSLYDIREFIFWLGDRALMQGHQHSQETCLQLRDRVLTYLLQYMTSQTH